MALAGTAFAADLPLRAPPPVYVAPVFSWTGFYVGGQLGYAWGKDPVTVNSNFTEEFLTLDPFTSAQRQSSPSGAIGGAHIGYNWQINQFVLGVETNVDATNFNGQQSIFSVASFAGGFTDIGELRDNIRSTIQGTFHGRAGWAWNNWLFYGTGGVAFTDFTSNYQFASILTDDRTSTRVGWTAGGGIEWAFNNNWIFGVEYRYSDFGHFTDNDLFSLGATTTGLLGTPLVVANERHHLTENRIQARVSYKFDWFNPAPVVAKY